MLHRFAKALVALTPFKVTRNRPNRFDAVEDFLRHLNATGYQPRIVIDGGAHLGWFARLAREAFPEAAIHMVEPQPACAPHLRKLLNGSGMFFHPVALTSERRNVRMVCDEHGDTGAYVANSADARANIDVQGDTLDNLFSARIARSDRAFLKLDLQGHELAALRGGQMLLGSLELVLTEFSFFQQLDEANVPDIVRFFDEAGFDLFDVVSISQRQRDGRAKHGDLVFVRKGSPLWLDRAWE